MKTNRYKLKITPEALGDAVWTQERCLYTISIGAANRSIDQVVRGFRWARAHFKRCALLVGDSLYRFTLQIQQGIGEAEATVLAKDSGTAMIRAVVAEVGGDPPEIIRCSDLLGLPQFNQAAREVETLFRSNQLFADSIDADAKAFVGRQAAKGRLGAIPREYAHSLAVKYLLEEVAVYNLLAAQGWIVDVYLGEELPTLAKIMTGDLGPIRSALTKRANISLSEK